LCFHNFFGSKRRHDTQYNGIQLNDTEHNDTEHNDIQRNDYLHSETQQNETQHNETQHNDIQPNNKNNITNKMRLRITPLSIVTCLSKPENTILIQKLYISCKL
jgi:hypothetical protein